MHGLWAHLYRCVSVICSWCLLSLGQECGAGCAVCRYPAFGSGGGGKQYVVHRQRVV